ncbi:Aspartic protease pepB [Pyrenophora teres f. maculata]|nr:Aspartic protease pepB [Pyrenophora teres f. maculata]
MLSLAQITAILVFTGAVVASPVEIDKRSAFTVEQVPGSTYHKNGPEQIIKALRKYGKKVPAYLIKAAEDTASNAVISTAAVNGVAPATSEDALDTSYLTPVNVGGTVLQMQLDTGSPDLWVYSSLQSPTVLRGHDFYTVNPAKILSGATWDIDYDDGSRAFGKVYIDTVTIGGITATSQAVEAAITVSGNINDDVNIDGLVGLAFSTGNTVKPKIQKTFFDNIKSQLTKPLFAVQLKYRGAGTFQFGFIDSTKYTGPITYAPVDSSDGNWIFTASGYSIGSGATTQRPITTLVDTGTTLVFLDDSIVKDYYSHVSGSQNSEAAGGYIVPCSATLSNFSIVVGGVKQTIPGTHIKWGENIGGTCFGGIQNRGSLDDPILGDIFLKSKYIIFDESTGSPRVGFGQQVGIPSS